MKQSTQPESKCDRCGASKNDPIAPCKCFYQNAEIILCDRGKDQEQWTDLKPIIWIPSA